jgi:hypothetical protein
MIFISNGDKTSRVLFHQIQHYAYWAIFSSNKHHGFYTLLNLNQDNIDPLIDSCLTLSELRIVLIQLFVSRRVRSVNRLATIDHCR